MLYRRRVRFLLCSSFFLVLFIAFSLYVTSPIVTRLDHSGSAPSDASRIHIVKANNCEIIDLAVVVRGYKSCRDVALLMKSILLLRHNPIRFHFLIDHTAKHILSTLLRTWHLYGVDYHFYDIESEYKQGINGQYHDVDNSSILFNDVLPHSVEKVISVEPTVLVSADIFDFWKMFSDMYIHSSVLGLQKTGLGTEEQFRIDVMLLDLKVMREKKWSLLWKEALSRSRKSSNSQTKLTFSDVLSYLSKQHQSLVFPLSLEGIFRFDTNGTQPTPTPCYKQQTVCARNSIVGSDLKQLTQEYDGNLLREKHIGCVTGPEFDQNALDYHAKTSVYAPPCTDFKREGRQERRTHPFYLDCNHSSMDPNDVTLLLHVTLDRLVPMLEPTCTHWEGPMSIAVFANDSEVSSLFDLISSSPIISSRRNIAYHIVYKEGTYMYYPINPLRIVAMENVRTQYVFLNDMDFLPSFGLYSSLKNMVQKFDLSHTVLVVPAFETLKDPKTFPFPRDKSALLAMIARNEVFQFHRDKYLRGHAPTDYPTWKKATEPYEIQWQPQYEPYLVASVNITPFDTRFVSRTFNKVSHAEELYYQRYKFYVVSDGFILHLPHALSSDAVKQRANKRHRECFTRRKYEWRADKVQEYGYEPYLVNLYKIWNKLTSSYDTSF